MKSKAVGDKIIEASDRFYLEITVVRDHVPASDSDTLALVEMLSLSTYRFFRKRTTIQKLMDDFVPDNDRPLAMTTDAIKPWNNDLDCTFDDDGSVANPKRKLCIRIPHDQTLDADNSGALDAGELAESLRDAAPPGPKSLFDGLADRLVLLYNTNDDGELDRDILSSKKPFFTSKSVIKQVVAKLKKVVANLKKSSLN